MADAPGKRGVFPCGWPAICPVWLCIVFSLRRTFSAVRHWHIDSLPYFGNHQTMKEGPDISIVAALIGNPACANMLTALLAGPALTATELAQEAGLSLSTVSGHLYKLEKASLIAVWRQGR